MLASIQEKRRQFEDGSKADEIAAVVSVGREQYGGGSA